MTRVWFAAALVLGGCASSAPRREGVRLASCCKDKGEFGPESSLNVRVRPGERGSLLLTVSWSGEIEPWPTIRKDGKPVELERTSMSGFGLAYECVYVLREPGVYEVRRRGPSEPDEELCTLHIE